MQKYLLGASPTKQTAMIRPFDDTGVTGDWREFNAGIVCLADDVNELLAAIPAYLLDPMDDHYCESLANAIKKLDSNAHKATGDT